MKASEILDVIRSQELSRGRLQACVTLAEGAREVRLDDALPAMRALLIIMEAAEWQPVEQVDK